VIVVDDGSRDSTAQVVEQFPDVHSNVRLIRNEVNRGRGASRRLGHEATQAPLIGFVDADIVVPDDWLERCAQELSRSDAASGIALPDGDCAVIWRICEPTLRRRPGSAEITGNNVLFRREALALVPFAPDSRLGEDFRLAKTMVRSGLRLATIDDLVVEHRESKTYAEAVSWMWHSGVDATGLLFEFRVVRPPDLAWTVWLAGVLAMVVAVPLGDVALWVAIVAVTVLTLLISFAFTASRFHLHPRSVRFLAALVISPPLILSYLLGRCGGLIRATRFLYDGRRTPRTQ
jgi:glycosyltransferase involved in cell wall biosynthesis